MTLWKTKIIGGWIAVACAVGSDAFALLPAPTAYNFRSKSVQLLHMALTPVGPFCPFRSEAVQNIDPHMDEFYKGGSATDWDLPTEMQRVGKEMQMGVTPDPERLLRVADGMDQSVDMWQQLMTRLRISSDFQAREYAKLTQAHLASHGVSMESTASIMKWQSGCMRAMAKNLPPPMPPPDLDLNSMMMAQAGNEGQQKPPSITSMAAAKQILSQPFTGNEKAFESPMVTEEYEKLCQDHQAMIEFGAKYDSFDPLGKLRYLDEMDKIQERWDVFFARFSLMGELSQDYVEQCNAFLVSMNMDEEGYRTLLKECHELMRKDAEAERSRLGI